MTNPDNIVRVRARNGGRASVYEANGWAQAYSAGLLEGNGVKQNTSADMNVLVGGSTTKPDVVLAENAAGYRVALDIVGQQAVAITKPASNSRISAIVAYTDDLSLGTTEDTVTGSPSSCGLIVVNGNSASSPSAPTDTQIRNAITADGATGSQAAYCVIATILVASNTTTITDTLITNNIAKIGAHNIDFATIYTTLFTGKSNGTITLSDSAENYDEIIIYYFNVDSSYCRSERVYDPNNKTVGLDCVYRDANITSIQSKRVAISGNQITNSSNTYGEWISNGTRNNNNHVYIYRVVGIKYN